MLSTRKGTYLCCQLTFSNLYRWSFPRKDVPIGRHYRRKITARRSAPYPKGDLQGTINPRKIQRKSPVRPPILCKIQCRFTVRSSHYPNRNFDWGKF